MIRVTSVEAQNRFGQLLDMVQRESVTITRHGRAAAILLSPQDMDALINTRAARTQAVAEFDAWRQSAALTVLPAAEQLTDEEVVSLVHELR